MKALTADLQSQALPKVFLFIFLSFSLSVVFLNPYKNTQTHPYEVFFCILVVFNKYFNQIHLCLLNNHPGLNVFSQTLQGNATPSKWFASMWSLMTTYWLSFPHIWQILVLSLPFELMFWPFSIIDFTFSSSSCRSPDTKFEIAILRSSFVGSFCDCWVIFSSKSI